MVKSKQLKRNLSLRDKGELLTLLPKWKYNRQRICGHFNCSDVALDRALKEINVASAGQQVADDERLATEARIAKQESETQPLAVEGVASRNSYFVTKSAGGRQNVAIMTPGQSMRDEAEAEDHRWKNRGKMAPNTFKLDDSRLGNNIHQ